MQRREPVFGLDIVRLAAAFIVTTYHLAYLQFASPHTALADLTPTDALPAWWWLTWWGWIGVQIFFVISGTVIAYSLAGASPAEFARKRVERLYPALLVCTAIALPVAIFVLGTAPATAGVLAAKMLMFVPDGPWLLSQFWTLPLEAMFYLAMWLLLLSGWQRHLPRVAWVLVLMSVAWSLTMAALGHVPLGRIATLLLFPHGCYFALGIYLAAPARFGGLAAQGLFLAVAVAAAAMQIRFAAAGQVLGHGLEKLWLVPFLVWGVAMVAIGLSVRFRQPVAARIGHRGALFRTMGRLTYPLYLVHMEAGVPMLLLLLRGGVAAPLAITAAVLASIVAALAVAQWLEPPMHRLVSAVLRGGLAQRLRLA